MIPADAFTISASGQYVTPSPYGQAAAHQHGRALEAGDELAREPALADARVAVEREERARGGRGPRARRCSRAARARSRGRRAATRGRATRRVRGSVTQTTRCAATGFSQPRSSSGPTCSSSMRSRTSRAAPGPMRISPGPASCCSRAARLTASPVANVDSASSSVTTSPDSIPIRAARPSSRDALERREPGADGALGVVLVRERHAEGGHHRVAGELLDDAAVGDDAVRDLLEELRDAAADDLRVRARQQLRRGDEIDEQDGRELPLHDLIVVAGQQLPGRDRAIFHSISTVLDPKVFKAYDVRGIYPGRARRGRRLRDRPRVRRAVRAAADRRRARHAPLEPAMAAAVIRGRRRRRRRRARPRARRAPRWSISRSASSSSTAASRSPPRTTRRSTPG